MRNSKKLRKSWERFFLNFFEFFSNQVSYWLNITYTYICISMKVRKGSEKIKKVWKSLEKFGFCLISLYILKKFDLIWKSSEKFGIFWVFELLANVRIWNYFEFRFGLIKSTIEIKLVLLIMAASNCLSHCDINVSSV